VESDNTELIEGVKTFFVVPDLSQMPEDFLLNFFLKGFETYYLLDDSSLDIRSKIQVLFSIFPSLILFFNTDREVCGIHWPDYIRSLKASYGDRAKIGVLFSRQADEAVQQSIEKTYLFDIGIYCGCIPMEGSKARNLLLLMGVLTANEARGRRKALRAICDESCEFHFEIGGFEYKGWIREISISHFSCVFDGFDPGLQMYEKVVDVRLKLAGTVCTADGVLFTKRKVDGVLLHIFIFRNSRNKTGLDPDTQAKVNAFIRSLFDRGIQSIAQKGFEAQKAKGENRLDSLRASPA